MRITKGALAALSAVLLAWAAAVAQTEHPGIHDPVKCPIVTVSCPDTGGFEPVTFRVNITGGDPDVTPALKWAVTGGRILSGQDTFAITVEPPAEASEAVATLTVDGYGPRCSLKASCKTYFIRDPLPRKIDEYGVIAVGDEKQRLDHFMGELQKDPSAQGYLVCYGGRRSRRDEAQRRCDRAKNFLVVSRGIDASRTVTVDAGYRERPTIELWLVPSGFAGPSPSPTVDPKEVRPPRRPRTRARH
jgi:hypothetical protein